MKLYIKTNTYASGRKTYELMEKHSLKLFGFTLKEWYTQFIEPNILSNLEYPKEYEHYNEVKEAQRIFETGTITYKGYTISPTNRLSYGRYLIIWEIRHPGENYEAINGICRGSIEECQAEIDSDIAQKELQKLRDTLVGFTIEE